MWRYGWGRARMVSMVEAERIRAERLSESRIRGAETRKRRRRGRPPKTVPKLERPDSDDSYGCPSRNRPRRRAPFPP